MVRLVFRPYTQVRKAICTSAHLRASTRVSSGFALLRHSSPSFGSQHVCSHSNLSQKITVGRWCALNGLPPVRFLAPQWVCRPPARIHVRLLGPCFKTGRMKSSIRQRPERAVGRDHAFYGARFVPRPPQRHGRETISRTCPAAVAHADQHPALSGGPAQAVPHPTGVHPQLPFASLPAISSTFNSLFKVLFIFPSRYLFAIGLLPIFSLGRNLPPT